MFDSIDELLEKIRLGEDSLLELKRVTFRGARVEGPSRNDLADELAAFANARGGVLVLGVDDRTRAVMGIPLDQLDAVESLVREVCFDSIKPPLVPTITKLELPNELGALHPIVRVDVPRSLFVHKSPGGYFQRVGSSKREMSPELLARLFQQRSQARVIWFDEQAVPQTTTADLDTTLAEPFTAGSPDDLATTARKLRLLTNDDESVERLSVAGALLCTHHPERWLAGASIRAVRYRGVQQDSNYQLDAATITGPLNEQIAAAMAFVRRNMRIVARKDPGRADTPEYDERAVFEAIVNAVAHRDYSVHGSKIRLFIFDDRLELYSPGPLPNTLTLESLRFRQSTRNELVTSLLAKCPVPFDGVGRRFLMEKRGDGVPIILDRSAELSGRVPQYRVLDDSEVLLTIFAARPAEPALMEQL